MSIISHEHIGRLFSHRVYGRHKLLSDKKSLADVVSIAHQASGRRVFTPLSYARNSVPSCQARNQADSVEIEAISSNYNRAGTQSDYTPKIEDGLLRVSDGGHVLSATRVFSGSYPSVFSRD